MNRHRVFCICVLASLAFGAAAQDRKSTIDSPYTPDRVPSSRPVAFVDVSVLPMTFNGVLEHQTVVTMHGRIHAVGPVDEIEIPARAITIDGSGRFLMPGLADMHTHLDIELGDGANEAVLWLANGVTTIFNLGDQITPLGDGLIELRDDILRGVRPGPTIYTASIAYGPDTGARSSHTFTTANEGRDFVTASKVAGYDFMKVYTSTTAATFAGISDQARVEEMAVVGHVPRAVGLNQALADGLVMVTHLNDFWCRAFDCGMNENRLSDAVNPMVTHGAWVATTLSLNRNYKDMYCGDVGALERYVLQEYWRFIHPDIIGHWYNLVTGSWNPAGCRGGDIEEAWDFLLWYSEELHEAGVPMVLGTDAPPVVGVPGWSLHDEMRIADGFMTRFDALRLATANAGRFMDEHLPGGEAFGTIEEGKRADLLLLEANPLDFLSNAKRRVGVMARGRWYSEAALKRQLEWVAYSYHGLPSPRTVSRRASS
ncbi:MAG: amidohydrolase family protein [Acidobacteria bacterium]|nr:amidohydrolase family protein [Acidobacteriota bacterium]